MKSGLKFSFIKSQFFPKLQVVQMLISSLPSPNVNFFYTPTISPSWSLYLFSPSSYYWKFLMVKGESTRSYLLELLRIAQNSSCKNLHEGCRSNHVLSLITLSPLNVVSYSLVSIGFPTVSTFRRQTILPLVWHSEKFSCKAFAQKAPTLISSRILNLRAPEPGLGGLYSQWI